MIDGIVVEEPRRARGITTHRVVLAVACILEAGVGTGVSAALLDLIVMELKSWDDGFFGGGPPEPFKPPPLNVAALVILPVVAVFAGATPSMIREHYSTGSGKALGLSVVLCLGAALVWVLLFAIGLNAENLPNLVRLIFIPAIPFVLVPLLVDRWT